MYVAAASAATTITNYVQDNEWKKVLIVVQLWGIYDAKYDASR